MKDMSPFNLKRALNFGQYEGRVLKWVIDNDSDYVKWALKNVAWFKLTPKTMEYLESKNPTVISTLVDGKLVSPPWAK